VAISRRIKKQERNRRWKEAQVDQPQRSSKGVEINVDQLNHRFDGFTQKERTYGIEFHGEHYGLNCQFYDWAITTDPANFKEGDILGETVPIVHNDPKLLLVWSNNSVIGLSKRFYEERYATKPISSEEMVEVPTDIVVDVDGIDFPIRYAEERIYAEELR
jgi:hypothetical protein